MNTFGVADAKVNGSIVFNIVRINEIIQRFGFFSISGKGNMIKDRLKSIISRAQS